MKKALNKLLNNLYLRLSDCDGMCNLCNPELKTICLKHKNHEKH